MKSRLILLGCAACLILPISADEDSPLGKQMESLNDAYKAFRKETDPAKGAALARDAQQALVNSMAEMPELIRNMPDGPEKAKASAAYRKQLAQCLVTLCEVEEAFLAGKTDKVAELVTQIKDLKKAGHDQFMEDE